MGLGASDSPKRDDHMIQGSGDAPFSSRPSSLFKPQIEIQTAIQKSNMFFHTSGRGETWVLLTLGHRKWFFTMLSFTKRLVTTATLVMFCSCEGSVLCKAAEGLALTSLRVLFLTLPAPSPDPLAPPPASPTIHTACVRNPQMPHR